jgi:hypothetical protein
MSSTVSDVLATPGHPTSRTIGPNELELDLKGSFTRSQLLDGGAQLLGALGRENASARGERNRQWRFWISAEDAIGLLGPHHLVVEVPAPASDVCDALCLA